MIKVYDRNMQLIAFLENAISPSYETPYNDLWSATFTLPADDPKNDECQPFNFVEIYDHTEHIGLFRILPHALNRSNDGAKATYKCEHVIATLLDDVLFQNHTVGNRGYYTSQVIQYILNKQEVKHWKLGSCSFTRQFEYNWENETLFAALFSVPKPFDSGYMWKWDTTSYPWTLNLVEPSTGVDTYIRYGHNLQGITKEVDPTNVITRIYPLGYGEGVNQLNITELNNGVPYLDAATQSQYGIISKVWADRRFTSAETLIARAQSMLDELSVPRISYKVDVAELFALTLDPIDKFRPGSEVRVIDEELGIDVIVRVVNVSKQDYLGDPGNVTLELANRTQNIASSMADLDVRQRINEVYAQGATNVNIYNLAENCDPTHPAKFRIWIPHEAVRINKVLLTYENEPFRANSRTIEAAPSTTSDPSSITTTEYGGEVINTTADIYVFGNGFLPDSVTFNGGHNHGIASGTKLSIEGGGYVTWVGISDHAHSVPSHGHQINLPSHNHRMEHTHKIPSHTHEIDYGIYEGPTATSNGILVDGNLVPGSSASASDLDLVNYFEVDEEGKIKRGQFHEIEIVPNSLSRVVATVIIQFFVQSRGGGDY